MKVKIQTVTQLFSISALLLFWGCTQKDNHKVKDLTGSWRMVSPVAMISEQVRNVPKGQPFTLNSTQLLKRLAEIKWTLTQEPEGLIIGVNEWITYDAKGEHRREGTETMVGSLNGNRMLIVERQDMDNDSAQIIFDCLVKKPDRISCIGYNAGGDRLFSFSFDLVRDRS